MPRTQFVRALIGASLSFFILAPLLAFSQNAPLSEVLITTQLAPNTPPPANAPVVSVAAANPTLVNASTNNSPLLTFSASFTGDTHLVAFIPGSYTVTATGGGYYYSYSTDCSGVTGGNGGAERSCVITLSTTPPTSSQCTTPYGYGCGQIPTPYQGPIYPSVLTCAPAYQTIVAGQQATFSALGGGTNGFNWQTPDRIYSSIGPNLTTIPQTVGMQTIIVSNGTQTATCTINVVSSGAGPILTTPPAPTTSVVYPGTSGIVSAATPTSYVSTYVPATYVPATYVHATLPDTGFEPIDSNTMALVLSMLVGVGILVLPYVRKSVAVIVG